MERDVECVWAAEAVLGEGPLWDPARGALWWVDIKGRRVLRLHLASDERREWHVPQRITALGLTRSERLIAATDAGFAWLDPATLAATPLHHPEPDAPGNRFNDGKVDAAGAFWAGTMHDAETEARGAVYRLAPDGRCERLAGGWQVPNGPAFAGDGRTVYISDSACRRTDRWRLAADGAVAERETFAQFGEAHGYPDGMTVDAEDHLWIAFWEGSCVRRLDPDGRIVAEVALPVTRPTSCVFAGPALDTLYITSARVGLTPEGLAAQPLAGSLFRFRPGVTGVAPHRFAGG